MAAVRKISLDIFLNTDNECAINPNKVTY